MSLKVFDFPCADNTETNNIDLNRLLSYNYEYLIEQIVVY